MEEEKGGRESESQTAKKEAAARVELERALEILRDSIALLLPDLSLIRLPCHHGNRPVS